MHCFVYFAMIFSFVGFIFSEKSSPQNAIAVCPVLTNRYVFTGNDFLLLLYLINRRKPQRQKIRVETGYI